MARYNAEERAAIARGEFFTASELAARPALGRSVTRSRASQDRPADPNDRPVSPAAMAAYDRMVDVCGYCWEPGDERSALGPDGMHPECAEVAK